jgi:23S rRNA (uracil1939-C5)-methyltransferase
MWNGRSVGIGDSCACVGEATLRDRSDVAGLPSTLRGVQVLRVERLVAGGAGLARDDDGRIVLVEGGLPGDVVRVDVHTQKRTVGFGTVVEVVEPSEDRVDAPCEGFRRGCGGCQLQDQRVEAQAAARREIVVDALRRIGKVPDPEVRAGPALPTEGYRTTVRAAVHDGRAGLRARRSHDVVHFDDCLVAHPLVEEVLVDGRFPDATDVAVRAGARTGERLVLVTPSAVGAEVPADVVLVGSDELARGRRAWFHEEVAGRRWRISARSFFQSRSDGADALVDTVQAALGGALARGASIVDAHCGVGLFAGALTERFDLTRVVAIERAAGAVADAKHNLADLGDRLELLRQPLERWKPTRVDAVVADPPRSGLGRAGVEKVIAARPSVVALVSCDAAALGRDVSLLVAAGFRLDHTVVVDLFPHTAHVECVSRLVRG